MGSGLPPVAVILEDPSHKEWTKWDLRLITAIQSYDAMTNDLGVPIHWDRSDRVTFDVGSVKSKSHAAIDRRKEQMAKRNVKEEPGKMYYPIPRTIDGGPMPTLAEFQEEQRRKRGDA